MPPGTMESGPPEDTQYNLVINIMLVQRNFYTDTVSQPKVQSIKKRTTTFEKSL